MFSTENLNAGYSTDSLAVRNLSLTIDTGEVLCLLGRNGAGKTTTLKAIMGLVPSRTGKLVLGGKDISGLQPHEIPAAGIGYVPQGRRLFPELTVRQNLEIGALTRSTVDGDFHEVLALFPVLGDRMEQQSGTLSGGEQQMLAMATALCLEPTLLLLDEPTEGLMPAMISTIRNVIAKLSASGVAILLVEQRIDAVIAVADRVSFMDVGEIRETLAANQLGNNLDLVRHYVGVG